MRRNIPHLDGFIHLNNAAGSLPDRSVYAAMTAHMELEARIGNTEAMQAQAERLEQIYLDLASLTGVCADRLALFGSNTSAWQIPFLALDLKPGDRILVGETEWGGNISAIQHRCALKGSVMDIIPSDQNGAIDTTALSNMLDENVRVVCVTWVPAINGLINPVHAIADQLADHPAWLFVDAAQSFGQVSTDLSNTRFDVTTVSTRKYIRGPRGVGFSVFSQRFLDNVQPSGIDQFSGPFIDGAPQIRPDARKFEYGESSFVVRMGLAEAIKLALKTDWRSVQDNITSLAAHLRVGLKDISGMRVHEVGDAVSGIVTFSHPDLSPTHFRKGLAEQNINSGTPMATYGPLWFDDRPAITRLSPHAFNTQAELDISLDVIETLVAKGA